MWGSKGSGNGQFSIPYSIGIDSKDNIYVVDRENHRVQKFDENGTFITKWGNGRGSSDNQFDRPEDIVLSPFGIFVADTGNDRLMKFNSNFEFVDKWGTKGTGDGQFIHPHAIDVDSKGNVYVGQLNEPGVQVFDSNGTFLGKIGTPCQMSTGKGCIDPDGPGPLELGDGQFSKPEHVSIDTEGNVFVVDRGNQRIQVFAPITNESAR
jgi:DNA-binding beta-propeller fold protein YncE